MFELEVLKDVKALTDVNVKVQEVLTGVKGQEVLTDAKPNKS